MRKIIVMYELMIVQHENMCVAIINLSISDQWQPGDVTSFNKTYFSGTPLHTSEQEIRLVFLYLRKTAMKLWLSRMTHSPKPMITAPKIYRAKKKG